MWTEFSLTGCGYYRRHSIPFFHEICGPSIIISLERVVLLCELTSGSRDAVNDILEGLLGLRSDLLNLVGGRIALLVAPVDFKSVELEQLVKAVNIFALVGGKAAELRDEAHQLVHVITREPCQSRAHE